MQQLNDMLLTKDAVPILPGLTNPGTASYDSSSSSTLDSEESASSSNAVPILPGITNLGITASYDSSSSSTLDSQESASSSQNYSHSYAGSSGMSNYSSLGLNSGSDTGSISSYSSGEVDSILQQDLEEMRRKLELNLPSGSSKPAWERLALKLCNQVESWMDKCKRDFKPNFCDVCVVHSKSHLDEEFVNAFIEACSQARIKACSLLDVPIDRNEFDFCADIINRSTKVFVLMSPALRGPGIHRTSFQHGLVEQLECKSEWKNKLIPLRLSKIQLEKYYDENPDFRLGQQSEFGLSIIHGLKMDDKHMTNKIKSCLKKEGFAEEKNERAERDLISRLTSRRETLYREIRDIIHQMRASQGDRDPSPYLNNICSQLSRHAEPTNLSMNEGGQVINLNQCKEINIGPMFKFKMCNGCIHTEDSDSDY